MEIYLMRHGAALPETANSEEPLSKEGVEQIQASSAAMKKMGIAVDLIVCSPKKRAHQTAALVAERLNYPYSDILKTETIKPNASPREAIAFLLRHKENKAVLIAGHLPSLTGIASMLLGADPPVRLSFENGSLCRIDLSDPEAGHGELVFHLPPGQMRLIAGTEG